MTGAAGGLTEWQARSFNYHDTIGEIWYATQFSGRIGRVDYFPEVKVATPQGEEWVRVPDRAQADEPQGTDDNAPGQGEGTPASVPWQPEFDAVWAAWERIQDPNGGRQAMFTALGKHRFLIGESVVFVHYDYPLLPDGQPDDSQSPIETWEVLSPDEVKTTRNAGKVMYERRGGVALGAKVENTYTQVVDLQNPQAGEALAWRFWRRHPRRSKDSDAPMKAVLDLCEELLLLRRVIRARARSRIPAGLLLLPQQAFPRAPGPVGEPVQDPMKHPVTKAVIDAITTAISDESSAASVAPVMLWVDERYVDKFKFMPLAESSRYGYPEGPVRAELVADIARGIEMPMEYLTGMGNVNHWGQWFIDEDGWKANLEPGVIEIRDDFTLIIFRPMLLASRQVNDPSIYRIGYDPHPIISRPDRSKDADAAFDRGAISYPTYRESKGFDESDAPTDDELALILQVVGGAAPATSSDGQQTDTQSPPDQSTTASAAPDLAWLTGGLDMALLRCREVAGSRLRNMVRRHDPQLHADHEETPAYDLAAALGRDMVTAIMREPRPERQLVMNGSATLAAGLRSLGLGSTAIHMLCQSVEQTAARQLYDPYPDRVTAA